MVCSSATTNVAIRVVVGLAWPAPVSERRFSYPFTSAGFVTAPIAFAPQRHPLLLGVTALLRLPAVHASRVTRLAVTLARPPVIAIGLGLSTAGVVMRATDRCGSRGLPS